MCGITGILDFRQSESPDRALLEAMVERLAHRGPDARGIYVRGPVGLAHARLSIVDIEGGGQPMVTSDGKFAITFNGEIFNHVELREELIALGYRFVSDHSDTEVILHAFREWGAGAVERFNGQWAFAIWDDEKKQLFLSRDRMGIRPLYYGMFGSTFVFGSEIKAMFVHPDVTRALHLPAIVRSLDLLDTAARRYGIRRLL